MKRAACMTQGHQCFCKVNQHNKMFGHIAQLLFVLWPMQTTLACMFEDIHSQDIFRIQLDGKGGPGMQQPRHQLDIKRPDMFQSRLWVLTTKKDSASLPNRCWYIDSSTQDQSALSTIPSLISGVALHRRASEDA
eukprot:1071322-Amphidinium_carterae.1